MKKKKYFIIIIIKRNHVVFVFSREHIPTLLNLAFWVRLIFARRKNNQRTKKRRNCVSTRLQKLRENIVADTENIHIISQRRGKKKKTKTY